MILSNSVYIQFLLLFVATWAIEGSLAGPILFEVVYKLIMVFTGLNMFFMGYKKGRTVILDILKAGTLDKLTNILPLVGLMVS